MAFAVARIDRLEACAGNAGSWSFDLADVYAHALRARPGQFPLHAAGAGAERAEPRAGFPDAEGPAGAPRALHREHAGAV